MKKISHPLFTIVPLLILAAMLTVTSSLAQAAQPPNEELVVAGTITNIHGKGMNDARVAIMVDGLEMAEVFTGKEGHFFTKTSLPAGSLPGADVRMLVERAGFINQSISLDAEVNYQPSVSAHPVYTAQKTIVLENEINAAFWLAAGVLLLIYVLIAAELMHRTLAALLGGAILLGISYTIGSFDHNYFIISFNAAMRSIDLNVIFLLMAMMIIVGVTKRTGLFQWMAYKAFQMARGNVFMLTAILLVITAVVSAFLDNVTTMLLIIPVTLEISRTLKVNPIALLLPEVFASNVGGTATLIGDPPNILIGSYANLSFMDFAYNLSAICFICLLVSIAYMLWWFRKDLAKAEVGNVATTIAKLRAEYRITNKKLLAQSLIMLGITVFLFVIHGTLHMEPSIAALLGASILLAISKVDIVEMLEHEIEWPTLIFFAFLFVVVGAAEDTGLIQVLAEWVKNMSQGSLIVAILLTIWVSAIASALVDNIPFTATMLPIVAFLTESIPGAQGGILWWCLALGACLGGNATMIGASANVVTVGLAEKSGYRISFLGYMKICAIPTVITLILATLWIIYVDLPHSLGQP